MPFEHKDEINPAVREKAALLQARGCAFLGSRYAVLGGAMSWISERNLVSAISNAGGFGVLACGAMSPARLDEEIRATQEKTSCTFGVNLITMHPELDSLIRVCAERKVSHIVLAGGLPSALSVKTAKDLGMKVICFAPALALAKRVLKFGADALIIEGTEAGGHVGPVSLTVLAQEILPVLSDEVPIFVAGGLGRGEAVLAYMEMGAAGAQLGTRFVVAHESVAHPAFKAAFLKASARDAVCTVQLDERFPVIPVRALVNEATRSFADHQKDVARRFTAGEISKIEAQAEIEHFWVGALRRAVIEGDTEHGSLMAGQSVGLVTQEQSVSKILEEILWQICEGLQKKTA